MKKSPYRPVEVSSLFYTAKKWQSNIEAIRSIKNTIQGYHELHYEDLIAEPEKTLKYVCGFLQVPFDNTMLQFHKKKQAVWPGQDLLNQPIVQSNSNKWKNEFTRGELDLIYAAAQDVLFELMYIGHKYYVKLNIFQRLEQ